MIDEKQVRIKLKELVEQFSLANMNKEYVNSQNEEWVKWNYIEPLLEILGWKRGDIEKEYRVLKGRATLSIFLSSDKNTSKKYECREFSYRVISSNELTNISYYDIDNGMKIDIIKIKNREGKTNKLEKPVDCNVYKQEFLRADEFMKDIFLNNNRMDN